jgi:hypothetical protein
MRRWKNGASLLVCAALTLLAAPLDRAAADLMNPGFEGGLAGYSVEGSTTPTADPATPPPTSGGIAGAATVEELLPGAFGPGTDVLPTEGRFFALLSTDGVTATKLSQSFTLPTGGDPASLFFDYRFMTDEIDSLPELNDSLLVALSDEQGNVLERFSFSRDDLQPGGSGPLTDLAIEGVGGFAAGTDWLTGSINVFPYLGRAVTVSYTVYDVFDDEVVTAVALDNLRFGGTGVIPEPSSIVLLSIGAGAVLIVGRSRRARRRAD